MDAHTQKLVKRYKITVEQARALVERGYKTPKDIIRARAADLEDIPGIGAATSRKLQRR